MSVGVGISPGQVEVAATTSNKGLVSFVSNEELDRLEEEKKLADKPVEPIIAIDDLAQYVRTFFNSAKQAKQDIENKMLASLRQIKGEYEADKLQAINEFGGSTDFIKLTQQKVRDTESWIIDIIDPYGDQTWDIEPTPISDIPKDIVDIIRSRLRSKMMQQAVSQADAQGVPFDSTQLIQRMDEVEKKVSKIVKKKIQELAKKRATGMKTKILDQLEEGGWNIAFRACVNDLARLKACIMKGPVFKRIARLKWEQVEDGKWDPKKTTEAIPTFSRVSPFDWYPASKSDHVNKGDAVEIEHLEPIDLEKMIGVNGYKSSVINEIITNYPNGFKENVAVSTERQDLEKDNTISNPVIETSYDMINYWGTVSGRLLIEYGMKSSKDGDIESNRFYSVNIKTINDKIIKEPTINPDPLGLKPYDVTSFIKNNDSQWGQSPPEQMEDIQSICNASVRALVNNMAIASGPITEMDQDRLAAGETGEIWPWKRILTTSKKMQESRAVNFYQADMNASQLLGVYEKFKREADDLVVPSFGRTDVGGAGRTSSGLSMIMGAAARNIKLAINNFDQDIVIAKIQKLFNSNMLFLDDDSIKGDIRIKVRGTGGVIAKEQLALRRNEFRATLRPTDEQLIGAPGLAYILRKNIESLDMDIDKAMPGFAELDELDALTPPPALGEGGPNQPARPRIVDVAGQQVGGENAASLFRESERSVSGEA